jgi:alpha-mannosidase
MPVAGAQLPGTVHARLALLAGADPVAARDAELGLRGVIGGADALLDDGASLVALDAPGLLLSALKPAEDGDGIVVRVLNPTDTAGEASLRLGFPVRSAAAVRLDESPAAHAVHVDARRIRFEVPSHAMRSVRLRT